MKHNLLKGFIAATALSLPTLVQANVAVHLFEWSWEDVAQECETYLGPKGFTAVQVSPPQEHVAGSQWWTRYQPLSYELSSRSGNRDQFRNMVDRCNAAGVDIYVDLVINHMSANGTSYPKVPYGNNDFHNRNCPGIDYGDADEVWNCDLVGLKDLKSESDYVQGKIADYINDLVSLGVKGFRIDAAKHMPPQDVQNIVSRINGNPYIFQEVIRADGEAVQPDMYTYIADVTEFQMEKDLAWHFRNGQIANLVDFATWSGRVDSSNALVFVANHDDQRQHPEYTLTWNDPDGMYYLANLFMLAYPYGYPRLMSSYYFSDHDQGPPASGVHTGNACGNGWVCEHRWGGTGNMVRFREVTSANWFTSDVSTDGNNRLGFGRGGLGYIALNNDTGDWNSNLPTGLPAGEYCDIIHGDFLDGICTGPVIVVDTSGQAAFSVPPRDAVALHVGARLDGCDDCPPAGWESAYLRGTQNGWGTTAMSRDGDDWVTEAVFGNGDANGPARFKITREQDWNEAYPQTDYMLSEGPGRYRIRFDDASKTLSVSFLGNDIQNTTISFSCANGFTSPGQSVYAVGNLNALGDWNPADAVRLDPASYPTWTGSVEVPSDNVIEWKCLKRNETDPGSGLDWEPGNNTVFNPATSATTAGGW